MSKADSSINKLHLEILHLKGFPTKKIEHEDLATTVSTNRGVNNMTPLRGKDEEGEKIINYEYLLSEKIAKSRKKSKKIEHKSKKHVRYDAYGEVISKHKKKQKVSFIDQISTKKPLETIINIQSFKRFYNVVTYSSSLSKKGNDNNCKCCIIY